MGPPSDGPLQVGAGQERVRIFAKVGLAQEIVKKLGRRACAGLGGKKLRVTAPARDLVLVFPVLGVPVGHDKSGQVGAGVVLVFVGADLVRVFGGVVKEAGSGGQRRARAPLRRPGTDPKS